MKTKYTGLTLTLLAATGLLATPYWIGVRAEQVFDASLDRISVRIPHARLVNADYRRGWFGAEARTWLLPTSVPAPSASPVAGEAEAPGIAVIEHRISHGPFPVELLGEEGFLEPLLIFVRSTVQAGAAAQQAMSHGLDADLPPLEMDSTLALRGGDAERVEALFGGEAPARLETRIAFDGSGESKLTIPPFAQPLVEAGDEVNWGGLTATLRFDPDFRSLELDAGAPTLTVAEADGSRLGLFGTRLRSASRQVDNGLWLGTSRFESERMEVEQPRQGGALRFEGLKLGAALEPAPPPAGEASTGVAETLTGRLSLRIDQAWTDLPEVGESEFGLGMEVQLRGLDNAALARLQEVSRQHPADAWDEAEGMPAPVREAFGELLAKTLSHSPSLAVERLELVLPEGTLAAAMTLTLDGAKGSSVDDIGQLLAAIEARADLALPMEALRQLLAKQKRQELLRSREQGVVDLTDELVDLFAQQHAKQQVQALLDSGMLVERDGAAQVHAQWSQGRLSVNGQPIPLPMP